MKSLLRFLFFLALSFATSPARAEVTYKWLGITGFALEDGETTLLFDPTINRPKVSQVFLNGKIESNRAEVWLKLKQWNILRADAIFVSHTHFDHALDIGNVMKTIPSKLYGTPSALTLARGEDISEDRLIRVKVGGTYEIGKFKVTILDTPHARILRLLDFAPGPIEKPLKYPARVWDYRTGESIAFLIEHPEGRMFFQQTTTIHEPDAAKDVKADVLFLTIANRRSTEYLFEKRIRPMGAKRIIPLHHDHFMASIREPEPRLLPGIKFDEFLETMKKLDPSIIVDQPRYGTKVRVFP